MSTDDRETPVTRNPALRSATTGFVIATAIIVVLHALLA